MTCGIYKLNFIGTNKVYIGQALNIEQRLQKHTSCMKRGTEPKKLQEAYNSFGNPRLEILEECTAYELDSLEIEIISIYKSNEVTYGFNTSPGGNSCLGAHCISHDKAKYLEVLTLLATPGVSWKDISKQTGVSEYIVSHISAGESHLWLKYEYPEIWDKVETIRNTTGRNTAFMQGIKYPKIVSPNGDIYEVLCPTHFAKEYNLLQPKLHEVLTGSRNSHRGWHLESYVPNEPYPRVVSPLGEIFTIKYGEAANFAREHGLGHSNLHMLLKGKAKSHKGWTLHKVD